jgi:hypothetical protein
MQRFHDLSSREEGEETQLASMGKDISEVKKLLTIPGIGSYSALAIYSEIDEISRFPDAMHLSANCGLVPRVDQSGDTAYYGHITKSSTSILRFFLVNSVHTTVKISKTFRASYRKLKKRIGKNKAIVVMARKLAMTDLIPYQTFQIVYFLLILVSFRCFTYSSLSSLKKPFFPSVELCHRYAMLMAQFSYVCCCERFYDNLYLLLHCEFLGHFRSPFLLE